MIETSTQCRCEGKYAGRWLRKNKVPMCPQARAKERAITDKKKKVRWIVGSSILIPEIDAL